MKPLILVAVLGLGVGVSAGAAQYTLLVYEPPQEFAKRTDNGAAGQAYWASYQKFGGALQAAGILRGGAALHTPDHGRTVTTVEGAPRFVRQTDSDSARRLGGYFVIDVDNLDSALDWAARVPAAANGGAVEVRPAYPMPDRNVSR